MKNLRPLATIGILLLAVLVIATSCKKKSDDTTPTNPSFTMSSTPDPNDVDAVYFMFKCTNMDIKLTKVVISDPLTLFSDTYDCQGASYLQNIAYMINYSYTKETGNWNFQFTGNRSSDGSGFVVTAPLYISK
ncbi:MAG TPA: hypothetical protein VMC08_00895 [Bacteroidales bacterium]|nr:hypothetical protein [Bacteroidales bacterium]